MASDAKRKGDMIEHERLLKEIETFNAFRVQHTVRKCRHEIIEMLLLGVFMMRKLFKAMLAYHCVFSSV